MVDVDPPAASLVVTGTASGSSESKHSGKGRLGKKFDINDCVCFLRDVFCNKKWFFKTGFHQHETCHVTVHVSVVFFLLGVVCLSFFCLKHA